MAVLRRVVGSRPWLDHVTGGLLRRDTASSSPSLVNSFQHSRGLSFLIPSGGEIVSPASQNRCHTIAPAFPAALQQVRHVYVTVENNDIDAAIKVYKRKMNNCKIEEKLREKRYYTKPSEQRKLAKHYKKLNRARRELAEKVRFVKAKMEKIKEERKLQKEQKRAKAAAEVLKPQSPSPSTRFPWS